MDRIHGKKWTTRSEVIAQNGMAATSQPLATQVAIDILKKGGNAVDAAIAANAVLGLVEPTGCGIGGDLFAIVWSAKEKKLYGLNASGRSPQTLTLDYFKRKGLKKVPDYGPLSVTVPGCVDGWFSLHKKFGELSWEEIFDPAIQYARHGFPVSEVIAFYWKNNVPRLREWPGFLETFTVQGKIPKKGEIFKNPALACTYEKIAAGGKEAFYSGEIAEKIEAYVKKVGGFLTQKDLSSHKSEWSKPVSTNYRGYEIWELPPNGQGIAALQMLNILEAYDLKQMGFGSAAYIHHFVEAKKLAFEDRAQFYADPDFNKIPVQELISKKYAAERRKQIHPQKAARQVEAGHPALAVGDTIYLTVADKEGNMVSLIQSNYMGMGSGLTPEGLGFVLQNRGALFNLEEGHFNTYAPSKRPFHTIIPAFITLEGKPYMSFGVMGGPVQPQMHAQIVINLVDFGMNLQEAGDAPRFVHLGSSQPTGSKMVNGGTVLVESGIEKAVLNQLGKMGHRIRYGRGHFGGYQAILYDAKNKVYVGASESRKDGQASGY